MFTRDSIDGHLTNRSAVSLTETVYRTDGSSGLGAIVRYALLSGIAVVKVVARFQIVGLSSLADLSGVVPGLLASGRASRGAGFLGVPGSVGDLASLPYDGALRRVGGLLPSLFFSERAGHPERCGVVTEGSK
ncbi:hypothetical protein C492_09705 [Natronococcus jeotgali DSM 18795]|uniref:Uncharacterized protein n=1 Tax=Natronococcus jeotgali DSM 18795 TaxID=1227498 RepID=L9XHD9_9EURY|nr:hypothetical protein [Natronococcus jeotgali]ELY61007.1 hypothetical protein C492_09705 [Natronococcus jeotgali DSM 18795]